MAPIVHELILGGAKSGKSRTAERRAAQWLSGGQHRIATLVATALRGELTGDAEMDTRIARHRADRALRVPELQTVEAPSGLGRVTRELDDPARLIVIDCLTLWLTQCLMPPEALKTSDSNVHRLTWDQEQRELLDALRHSRSPIVLVSNEIGLGVMPMSREARSFVDTLGVLHQLVAERCGRVTLMVASCEWTLKQEPRG